MNYSPSLTKLQPKSTRDKHISKVLYLLQCEESLSRAELSRKTGLAKSSMSSIIEEMLGLDFLVETEPKADGVGKPATQLVLNKNCRSAIGVEINPGFVAVILINLVGNIIWKEIAAVEPGSIKATYLNTAEEFIGKAICEAETRSIPLLGIGVGIPGSIDPNTGRVYSSSSLGWGEVPLRESWEDIFNLPVAVDTEANMGAIGEHLFGCAQDIDTFLYIDQSFGFRRNIGLAMMLDGKLWRGMEGRAGRIGHMVIDPHGPPCDCGQNGCWRVMTSDEIELQQAIEILKMGRPSSLQKYAEDDYTKLTVDIIHQSAIQGDELSREVFKRRLEYTELAISNLINIFDPGVVVTTYSYTTIHKPEVEEIMAGLGSVIHEIMQEVHLNTNAERRHASHTTNAAVNGAASVLISRFMDDPKGITNKK